MSPKEPEDTPHQDHYIPQELPIRVKDTTQPKPRTRKISLGIQIHPPSGEIVTIQKPKHPAIAMIRDGEPCLCHVLAWIPVNWHFRNIILALLISLCHGILFCDICWCLFLVICKFIP